MNEKINAIEITTRIRNNAVKRRRLDLGFTQKQLGEAVGCSGHEINKVESFFHMTRNSKGERVKVLPSQKLLQKLGDYFHCAIEELYPFWAKELEEHTVVKEIDEETFLLSYHEAMNEPLQIEESYADKEEVQKLLENCTSLWRRDRYVLMRAFGLDGFPESTLDDIGLSLDVTGGRVGQILNRALRKLRTTANDKGMTKDHRDEGLRGLKQIPRGVNHSH